MNIENLTPQELEQLQSLLNKMNPQIIDPVNKMIDDIMDEFNFDKVQKAMDCLDWKWVGEDVTVGMLKTEARRLLRNAVEARLDSFKGEYRDWETDRKSVV